MSVAARKRAGAGLILAAVCLVFLPQTLAVENGFECRALSSPTKHSADLCWLVRAFLEAHRQCEFEQPFLGRITNGASAENTFERTKDHKCLGEVEIDYIHMEDNGLIGWLELRRKRKGDDYVVMMVYSGKKWLMYWPSRTVKRIT